jgi:hypothetical protein
MNKQLRIILHCVRILCLAAIAALPSGCSMPHLPSAKEIEMVRSGRRVLVLLRVVGDVNGQPYEAFKSYLTDDNVGLALGGFETGGEPQQITSVFFLSDKTRKDGWAYLVLEPGLYYLAVQPSRTTNANTYAAQFKSAPLFRMDVPSATAIVYAGTLYLPGTQVKLLFGDSRLSFISEKIAVRNDEELARKIAAEFFPEFGVPKTILMRPHKGPIILRTPGKHVSE